MTGQATPVPPPEAVEAVMKALGCLEGPPAGTTLTQTTPTVCRVHHQRVVLFGGFVKWTDRGCPVAVKAAAAVVAALGHPNQDALARAWAEGKTAGLEQAADHVRTGRPNIRVNPYGGKP